jgi:site-specific recombinase XerD
MLISEAFTAYATDVIAFRNQSRKTEEHHFVALKSLVGFVGDIPIEQLSFIHVRDWKLSMEGRKLSAITIRGYLIKLRVVLAYLESQGHKIIPPAQIPLPKRIERVPEIVTPQQVEILIRSTRKARNKAIISMLYSTGLRVSELCSLNRIDVQEDYFTVVGKGGKSRICFIDKRSRRLLNRYLAKRSDNDPALFISPLLGARITPGGVQELFKYARKKAGFDFPVHPHTLRHSFATNLMSNGAHIYTIQRLMGHASLQTTEIYLHITDPQLEAEFKKHHSV